MGKMSNKKKIALAIAMLLALGSLVFTNMNQKNKAQGVVAKVTIKPGTTSDDNIPTETEGMSKANPYKEFVVTGELPEEYWIIADEYLKDDLGATELTVLDFQGKADDKFVYYAVVNSFKEDQYLEIAPTEMGGAFTITSEEDSPNTGMSVEKIKEELGERNEDI